MAMKAKMKVAINALFVKMTSFVLWVRILNIVGKAFACSGENRKQACYGHLSSSLSVIASGVFSVSE